MAIISRLYLFGIGVAVALCIAAVAFPKAPPTLMLGLLGGTFLALASRMHQYTQAQQAEGGGDGRIASPTAGRARNLQSPANAVAISS